MMTSGLYQLLKGDIDLQPTTATFRGVNQNNERYEGIMVGLPIRLTDRLATTLNVHVIPNNDKYILLGNDLIGGAHAKLTRISSSDSHSFIVL